MTDSADPESCYSPRRQCYDKLNNAPTSATYYYSHRTKESKTSAYFVFKFGSSRCACVPRMEHAHIPGRVDSTFYAWSFFLLMKPNLWRARNIAGGGLPCGCIGWLRAAVDGRMELARRAVRYVRTGSARKGGKDPLNHVSNVSTKQILFIVFVLWC